MCYSTALRKKREEIEQRLLSMIPANFEIPSEYKQYFHLNGFSHGNLYIIKMESPTLITPAQWGLVPDWAHNDPAAFYKKSNTLNAKSETLFERSSYKKSAQHKRCLILADGFFEPHHENGVVIPNFCYQPSEMYPEGDLFLFAGLYNEIDAQTNTATIITMPANPFFTKVHNKQKRMPLVLDDDNLEDWLDEGMNAPSLNEIMANGFTTKEFKAYPVSRNLYKKNMDTNQAYIVEPSVE